MDRSERSAQRYVKGLQEILSRCYKTSTLLSENEEFVGLMETSSDDQEQEGNSMPSLGSL